MTCVRGGTRNVCNPNPNPSPNPNPNPVQAAAAAWAPATAVRCVEPSAPPLLAAAAHDPYLLATLALLGALCALVITSTAADGCPHDKGGGLRSVVRAFSAVRNLATLTAAAAPVGDARLQCLDGMRVVSMGMILLGHGCEP